MSELKLSAEPTKSRRSPIKGVDVVGKALFKAKPITPENPKRLGLLEDLRAFKIPVFDGIKGTESAFYSDLYARLCQFDVVINLSQGQLARLKGTLWNRLYNVDASKRKDSVMSQDEFRAWRSKHCPAVEDGTMENYRNIANHFPIEDRTADSFGISEMLEKIRVMKGKPATSKAVSSGGSSNRKSLPELDPLPAKIHEQAGLLAETLATVTDEDDDEPVKLLGDFVKPLEKVADLLMPLASGIKIASDRFESVGKTRSQLKEFESELKTIEGHILDIRAAMLEVRNAVTEFEEAYP